MKRVTVIVPAYNSAEYIGSCLCSLDTKIADVIVVNDCSTDYTVDIVKKFPVKLINNNFNLGQGVCRNLALSACETEYVMFCDSDDFYCEYTIPIMLDAVQGKTFACFGARTFGDSFRQYGSINIVGERVLDYNTSLLTPCVCWNKIYRKDSIINKNLSFSRYVPEDNYFWFCYSCANFLEQGNYIQDPLYNYRINENGSFGKQNKSINPRYDTISVFFSMYDYLVANGLQMHIKFLFESYFVNFIRHYKHITGFEDSYILDRLCTCLNKRHILPGLVSSLSKVLTDILNKTYNI